MEEIVKLGSPLIQFGFAGFCLLLLGIVVWLITRLLAVIKENNAIIARNTEAVTNIVAAIGEQTALMRSTREELLKRPCMAMIARIMVNEGSTYDQVKHLEMLQAVITRMAQNSFALKGWSVTIVAGILALGVAAGNARIVWLALVPALAFWGLDGYYLRQERLFRKLYDRVRKQAGPDADAGPFSMNTKACEPDVAKWLRVCCSVTELGFHGPVVLVVVVLQVILACR